MVEWLVAALFECLLATFFIYLVIAILYFKLKDRASRSMCGETPHLLILCRFFPALEMTVFIIL